MLALFVLAALTQQLGVRTDTVQATSGDLEVTVRYADRARGALAVPFTIEVEHAGGFDGPIEVRTSQRYLAIFDDNGFEPDPAESPPRTATSSGPSTRPLATTSPSCSTPASSRACSGREDGSHHGRRPRASRSRLEYTTWVAP